MSLFNHCSNLQDIAVTPVVINDYIYDINYMELDFKKRVQKILDRCNSQHIINRNFFYPTLTMQSPCEFIKYYGIDAISDYIMDVNIIASTIRRVWSCGVSMPPFIYIPSENIYIDYNNFLARDKYADKCYTVNKELQSNEIDIKVYPSLFGDIEFDTDSNDLIFRKTKTRCIVKDRATTADKIIEEAKQLQIHVIRRKQNATTSRE